MRIQQNAESFDAIYGFYIGQDSDRQDQPRFRSGACDRALRRGPFSYSLDRQLGHNLYGFAQNLRVNDHGHVGEGIVAAAGDVTIEGDVKRSVDIVGSGNADVSGSIGRELTMNGGSLTLTNTARVGGNLTRSRAPTERRAHLRGRSHFGQT